MFHLAPSLNRAWRAHLERVMFLGAVVRPRGLETKEVLQQTLIFDMNHPVVTVPERKLGYRFLAAEAWWLLTGRNDVASIAPYSQAISQFSDDGETFFGSYGPPFVEQLPYVANALLADPDTRQATMTFWRPSPPKTKDVPCTVALDFKLRNGRLHTCVFMRSSDAWLGVPYDAFNFTMMTCRVLELVNAGREDKVQLGNLHLTAASAHLYARDFPKVDEVFQSPVQDDPETPPVPPYLYGIYEHPEAQYHGLLRFLEILKDVQSDQATQYRWWLPR
jgi:thymidylate synthase